MLSLWINFRQWGKGFYLPDQKNWFGQLVMQPNETDGRNRLVFKVRSLDSNWFFELPEGLRWADGHQDVERPIDTGRQYTINSDSGTLELLVLQQNRACTVYGKYIFPQNGRLTIGADASNDLCVDHPFVAAHHGTLMRASAQMYAYMDNSEKGSFINNVCIKREQRQLYFGDRLDIPGGLSIILLDDVIAINQPDSLRMVKQLSNCEKNLPQTREMPVDKKVSVYINYHRSPRIVDSPDESELEIESPLQKAADNELPAFLQIGPSITMVLPMATMALFMNRGAASILMVGTSAMVAIFWSVLNRKYRRQKQETDEDRRQTVCRQYYAEVEDGLMTEYNRVKKWMLESSMSAGECASLPGQRSGARAHRLWERMPSHRDFLLLRIGLGTCPLPLKINISKEKLSLMEDPLRNEPLRLKNTYENLEDVPITVDVKKFRLIGVLGNEMTPWMMQNMVLQAAANHSYHDVRIAVLHTPETAHAWEWVKWLPHVFSSDDRVLRMTVSEPAMVREVLSRLDNVFSIRADMEGEKGDKEKQEDDSEFYTGSLPYYLVFVTDPSLIENHPVTRHIHAGNLGFSLFVQAPSMELLPKECQLIMEGSAQLGKIFTSDGDVTGVRFDMISSAQLETFAKNLAPYRVLDSQGHAAIPTYLTFLDVYKARDVREMDIWRFWNENKTYEGIHSFIGMRAGNTPFALNIKFGIDGHGPHGLLAGTTGSGKSVLLQSLILSLAVNYSPRDVQFVLIDYKGGGTSDVFRDLPHVVGVIDNLQGERTIYRALASIDGEIKRRQALFKQVEGGGVADIDDYIRIAETDDSLEKLSHLVVVIDEFAELKTDQPDFMASIIKAARVGRSAGLHLILATQTPSGSVSDEIKANTNFRICLRVADASESRYMLNRPDAAYLRGMGRAYVQVGNDEVYEQIQTSFSGATYDPLALTSDEEPRLLNEAGMPVTIKKEKSSKGRKQKQLDAVLRHIHDVAEAHRLATPLALVA